jgi:hypothetical protein
VYKWESSPDLMAAVQSFPDGIPAFLRGLGPAAQNLTLWAHNGRWMHTPYASEYPFSQGLPQGRQLWDYLFEVRGGRRCPAEALWWRHTTRVPTAPPLPPLVCR